MSVNSQAAKLALLIAVLCAVLPQVYGQASRRLPPPVEQKAVLRLVSPAPESVLESRDVDLFFEVKGVDVAPDKFRIVVLVGGTLRETVDHVLKPATFRDLRPGTHLVRAFLVSPRGAMLRAPESQVITLLHVLRKEETASPEKMPLLTVASPQGIFNYEDSRLVLFDFTTRNLMLGERGLKLKYQVGDFTGYLSQNSPVFFTELPPGEHILRAEIVGEDGRPLGGPYLSATCRFTVREPPPRALSIEDEGVVVARAIPLDEELYFGAPIQRVRVISPAPGLSILADDPAWLDDDVVEENPPGSEPASAPGQGLVNE